MEAIAAIIGVIGLVALVLVYQTISWGIVCLKFWQWFMLPVFPLLPNITLFQAIGIMFFFSLFTANQTSQTKEYKNMEPDKERNIFVSFAAPWVTFLIAYLFHLFV